ncbi:MAG: ATP-binding cassette domain-containing protein [candidate division Zixibacteria bacterium]|nr:ATP-binding cassette domain-containing protein [candidate division Zixibacteria bacterium]
MSCHNTVVLETRHAGRQIIKNGNAIRTVDNVSYAFNKAHIYNLIGPSGAGKSSLLRLLNRLDEPTEGEVRFFDKPLAEYPPTELRRMVSMLFQTPYLFPGTVRDNLQFCCCDLTDDKIGQLLTRVGLDESFAGKDADDLSGGERQRVAIARALSLEPEVLLLDEPTASLDPTSSQTIEDLILRLSEELCLTTIIVTHHPNQALRLGGETLFLVKGRLVETGKTEKVLKDPETELARKYINRELR